ncbi:MAG TPA: HEPN domain-containing protein [Bacteroidales bacterium]|nr:HEPN domain-containing protein [Bacteroidales bacterium]HPM93036.1 HEPN domain-containing protein [Bacteroidales bacterium]
MTEENRNKLIHYWIDGSDEDFDTMLTLFDSKRYSWALFIGHLMLEKLFKAYFVKMNSDYPPYIHNLLRLAELSGLLLTQDQKERLLTITAFKINARYDDYKTSFKLKCTPEFTARWLDELKEIRTWIKTLLIS